jgi:protein-S-isoprenylcysteine O-methyltransferase Ste14
MRFPRWAAPINWGLGLTLGHIALPWLISLDSVRHGWLSGLPSGWNLVGIVPVCAGLAIILWALSLHFISAEHGWEIEMTPRYLLVRGPYHFTRNPMYVAALAIWFGWTVFYGSVALLLTLACMWTVLEFAVIPFEERRLEQRWGSAYLDYRQRVPRWFGLPHLLNRS